MHVEGPNDKRVLSRFKQKWVKCAHHKKIGPTMPWKNFSRDRHPNPNSNPKRKVTEYLKNICGEKANVLSVRELNVLSYMMRTAVVSF
jgi:hypothetical protein